MSPRSGMAGSARVGLSRRRLRKTIREPIWTLATAAARPTARFRVLPDYLIIGAQRSGTTSLQNALGRHPNVASAWMMKGVHYFDTNFDKDLTWYRAHFPTSMRARAVAKRTGSRLIVGEASPYYLFHPAALERVKATIPEVKLIALLRDPVERTISHHRHEVRNGYEHLNLDEAIEAEPLRLAGEEERLRDDLAYVSFPHQHYSYVSRSTYAPQVARLLDLFPIGQVLILQSEELFNEPAAAYSTILSFLGLPDWDPPPFPKMNATKVNAVPEATRRRLLDMFDDSNRQLFGLLGREFSWG